MKTVSARGLILGGVLFLVGAVLLLLWMEVGSGILLGAGVSVICIAGITLAVAGRLLGRESNLLEHRHEQQLWRSGPLGRWWLGRRSRRR